jgi:Fic-DOC domain mobile mystery protein B
LSLAQAGSGQTPLTADELAGLIPNLSTKEELNEWERENILSAASWASSRRNLNAADVVTDDFIRELHKQMFDQTWKWAGQYRKTEKNIGLPVYQMRELLATLLGDVRYWIANKTYTPDEIAIRFHHRLVFIHLFPNGNGRHARLIADLLIRKLGGEPFSWGSKNLINHGNARTKYIEAVQAADKGDYSKLIDVARS